jgi:hypothetical protein
VKCDVDMSATVVVELLCVCCGRRRNRVDGECNEWHVAFTTMDGRKVREKEKLLIVEERRTLLADACSKSWLKE